MMFSTRCQILDVYYSRVGETTAKQNHKNLCKLHTFQITIKLLQNYWYYKQNRVSTAINELVLQDAKGMDEMRLQEIKKMLKTSHFNARMNALNEVGICT